MISQFECGHPDLDYVYNTNALMYQEQLVGHTSALTLDSELNKIVGGFSVSNRCLEVDNLPISRRKMGLKPISHTTYAYISCS